MLSLTLVGFMTGIAGRGFAQGFIRDTEIENTIRVYSAPIFEAADLDVRVVQVTLVNDKRLNAFVAGGQKIFLNTGLLMQADHAGQVMGVIAHEAGHITGGHLARFREGLENAETLSLVSLVLGIPAAILAGRGDVAAASSALGQHLATRSLLQYTRSMEQSADQAAVNFLDAAGVSSRGLEEFMRKLERQDVIYSDSQNSYTRTHPLSKDRVAFVQNHLAISRFADAKLPPEFEVMHERMRAKLRGFLLPPEEVANIYREDNNSVYARYARSISLMKQHRVDEAIALARQLADEHPGDAFFHELMGDIYKDAGRLRDAIAPYEKALEILPWAALIHRALAQVQIELDEPELYRKAIEHLKEALRYEPQDTLSWRLQATAYHRLGDIPNATLAQAELSIRTGKAKAAQRQAVKAQELLPQGSPGWLRAQDIEFQARKLENKQNNN